MNKYINRYPMPDWATHQVIRMDGRVEDICKEHGVNNIWQNQK